MVPNEIQPLTKLLIWPPVFNGSGKSVLCTDQMTSWSELPIYCEIEKRLRRYQVSGQQSDSCAFLCNGGYADKRQVSRGERERPRAQGMDAAVFEHSHYCFTEKTPPEEKFSFLGALFLGSFEMHCEVFQEYRYWILKRPITKGGKRCFPFNGRFKINLLKMIISRNKKCISLVREGDPSIEAVQETKMLKIPVMQPKIQII